MSIASAARRLVEIADLVARFGADLSSRRALLGAYRAALADPTCADSFSFDVVIAGRRWPLTLRASDIFTLAEVLHEGQYRLVSKLPERPVVLDAGANVGVSGGSRTTPVPRSTASSPNPATSSCCARTWAAHRTWASTAWPWERNPGPPS